MIKKKDMIAELVGAYVKEKNLDDWHSLVLYAREVKTLSRVKKKEIERAYNFYRYQVNRGEDPRIFILMYALRQ